MSIRKRGVVILIVAAMCLGGIAVATGSFWVALSSAFAGCIAAGLRLQSAPKEGSSDAFAAQLISVQEEERKRLSRELHDGVGQVITALKMELSRVKGTVEDTPRLQRARSHADEALTTIRNV